MFQSLSTFLEPETLITLLVAVAAFAAVLSAAAPLLENDPLKARMKLVTVEKERLRAQQKLKAASGEVRLRDTRNAGVAKSFVEILNLRKIFEAETSRELLRQAGLRSERHLILYLASRVVAPIGLAVLTFVYISAIYGNALSPQIRISASAFGAILGNYAPRLFMRNLINRRQASIRRAWPDSLDLMLICVESGMSLEQAFRKVAAEIGGQSVPLAEELSLTTAELSFLSDRKMAFENLTVRTGLDMVKSLCTALIQAERYGTPLGQALRVLAQEGRDDRMNAAEKKAAALPPQLTVPMILFFLPVLLIVILVPAVINVYGWD